MVGTVQDRGKKLLDHTAFFNEAQSLPGTNQRYDPVAPSSCDHRRPIYIKDQKPADIYIVIEGMVRLEDVSFFDRKVIYDFRGIGELFGDTHGHGHYLEYAYAVGPALVKRVEQSVFIDYGLGHYLDLANREFDKRLRESRNDLAAGATIAFRTANALLRLSRRFETLYASHNDQSAVCLPLTQNELADYVGASRESVSKTFKEMREAGVIVRSGHRSMIFSVADMEEHVLSIEDELVWR